MPVVIQVIHQQPTLHRQVMRVVIQVIHQQLTLHRQVTQVMIQVIQVLQVVVELMLLTLIQK